MTDGETVLEEAQAKAEGLQRWFRARLLNRLIRLLVGFIVLGGLASTTTSHSLLVAIVFAAVFAVIAVVMTVRILLILRELRHRPERAVARLTKRRKLIKAGFAPVA